MNFKAFLTICLIPLLFACQGPEKKTEREGRKSDGKVVASGENKTTVSESAANEAGQANDLEDFYLYLDRIEMGEANLPEIASLALTTGQPVFNKKESFHPYLQKLSPEAQASKEAARAELKRLKEEMAQICPINKELFQKLRTELNIIRDDETLSREEKRARAKELFENTKEEIIELKNQMVQCYSDNKEAITAVKQQNAKIKKACFVTKGRGKITDKQKAKIEEWKAKQSKEENTTMNLTDDGEESGNSRNNPEHRAKRLEERLLSEECKAAITTE